MPAALLVASPQARLSYLALYSIRRTFASFPARLSSDDKFKRSDFSNQSFTGYYEPGQPTTGPIRDASPVPRITPRSLKDHLDLFVVGQDRAKRVLSVAVYNHYQRVQELKRRDDEEDALLAQQERYAMRHPVEEEYPGQQPTVNVFTSPSHEKSPASAPLLDTQPLTLEKANVLMLGPSGVGKTLMAKTLARVLEVPFSMSDCTPFTQAGYIGEDVDVCVQRLLAAANYDVESAERGIICLDELDKIATAKVSHGKDVSGEGVQQALLKLIEGTTIQVQAKQERNSNTASSRTRGYPQGNPAYPTNSPLGHSNATTPNKGDTYNVNTDNILFICTGAFTGLHKHIMNRISRGSIGFGANVRPSASSSSSINDPNDPTIPAGDPVNDELFRKHLPFYNTPASDDQTSKHLPPTQPRHNTLDLITPSDLRTFGLIPELIGRLPITTCVHPLTLPSLVRVLTEPRNSILSQYTQLFALSGIELRLTTASLHAVAQAAQEVGTGARGLRTVMERVLQEAMFDAPGSACRFVAVGENAVRGTERVGMWGRRGEAAFRERIRVEEEEWEWQVKGGKKPQAGEKGFESFEQYRENVTIAGSG